MRTVALSLVLLMFALPSYAQNLKCDVGPTAKAFGEAEWLVYACDDGASIAMITPNGSTAFPFFFGIQVQGDKINVHGEGTGNKAITDKAYQEILRLKPSDINHLRQEAIASANH